MAQRTQEFVQLKPHLFQYDNHIGKLHEFSYIFENDEEQAEIFKKFNKTRKTQKFLNYTSLGVFSIGMIGAVTLDAGDSEHNYNRLISFGVGFLGGGAIAIFGNLFAGVTKATHRNRLFDSLRTKGLSQITFQGTSHGIGIVYSF